MVLKYNFLSLDLRLAILIFILTSSIYLIFMDGNTTSDGYFYFLCAQSIIADHDLSIEPELPYGNPIDSRAPQRIDGKKYLYNHFGWPILLLPLTALGTFLANFFHYKTVSMFIASTTNCFITAFTCIILYLFSRKLKYSPRTSILLSLLYGFTTMVFPYATNSFCEPANTLMILLSLFWLYGFSQNRSYPILALSGLSMGYACFIRIWDLFLLPGFFLYLIFCHLKKEKIFKCFKCLQESVIFLLPILFMFLLNEAYFYFTTGNGYFLGKGNSNPVGYSDIGHFKPFSILPIGISGLLFSPGKSLFLYNPLLLLIFFNFKNFYLKHRPEAWIFAYIFVAHLILIGSISPWTGDLAWGPRYLLPVIPFLILFLARGEQKNKLFTRLLIVMALGGLIVQVPSLLVDTDLHHIQIIEKGISDEETIYFNPRLSPIIGTWNMLLKEIGSLSKDRPTGLSPWFFRLFDQEIHTQGIETLPITSKITILVWSVIIGLIFIAMAAIYTILCLLRQDQIKKAKYTGREVVHRNNRRFHHGH